MLSLREYRRILKADLEYFQPMWIVMYPITIEIKWHLEPVTILLGISPSLPCPGLASRTCGHCAGLVFLRGYELIIISYSYNYVADRIMISKIKMLGVN